MDDILSEILSTLQGNESAVLATIISSSGSTPLPSGSMLLVRQAGKNVMGTVGGGAVEAEVIRQSAELLGGSESFMVRQFELSDGTLDPGMICGGTIDVLIERIGPEDQRMFSELLRVRDETGSCILLRGVSVSSGLIRRLIIGDVPPESPRTPAFDELCAAHGVPINAVLPLMQRAVRQERMVRTSGEWGEVIVQPVVGVQPLIIFGGGHVGRSLSRLAALSGFSVTVVDDRPEFAQPDRFPEAEARLAESWLTAFDALNVTPVTSIVIVTSGHTSDADVLREAVGTRARYIGMIGSKKKVAASFSQLRKSGVDLGVLKRVHAPIGLDLGAVTADEIAVSIVAELIRVRRSFAGDSVPLSAQMQSWFEGAG